MTWVLLRGLTRERRHWGGFTRLLEAALDEPVVALDLPGTGARHRERSPLRIEAMVESCRSQLQAEGFAPPYQLLALSLGAMVALAWARTVPAEIAHAVLINTSLRGVSPFHHRLRPAAYRALATSVLAARNVSRAERAILRLTSRNPTAGAAALDDWISFRTECPVSARNTLRQLAAAARFVGASERPQPPVLLLASGGDALVDPRCSARLAAAWGLPIAMHPSAGHDLTLDDAGWVVDQLARWRTFLAARQPDRMT